MARLIPSINDLQTRFPKIAKEAYGWDPRTVTPGSNKRVQWQCAKNKRHIWLAQVNGRTGHQKQGCPFCSNRRLLPGDNDLSTTHPQIAKQAYGWDPRTVVAGSTKKMQWQCPKNKSHIWSALVNSRTRGIGCIYCAHLKVFPGDNDLATTHPQIAKEAYGWDPRTIISGSGKKLEWKCEECKQTWWATVSDRKQGYGCSVCAGKTVIPGANDLKSQYPAIARELVDRSLATKVTGGGHKKLEWKCEECKQTWWATVSDRKQGYGCSVCAGKTVIPGANDLKSQYPAIARELVDRSLATKVTGGSGKKLDWKCRRCGFIWSSTVYHRTFGRGCPACAGKTIKQGDNDLASQFPKLANEAYGWNPKIVHAKSSNKLKWKCRRCGYIWTARVADRTSGLGCPACANKVVVPGMNDLATTHPNIARELCDRTLVTKVPAGSTRKLKWKCRTCGHLWVALVLSRTLGQGCPACANKVVVPGMNDLATTHSHLAKELFDRSLGRKVTAGSHRKLKWKCNICTFVWNAAVGTRTGLDTGCPVCAGHIVLRGYNDLATTHPHLVQEIMNPRLAKEITSGSGKKVQWKCKNCEYVWWTKVVTRTRGSGCPECAVSGFSPNKDAWLYLMQRPGEQQLGITNIPKDRMSRHASNGWRSVDWHGPAQGEEVLERELRLKQWIKNTHGTLKGTTENWSTSKFSVQTLRQLCIRAKVDLTGIPRDVSLVRTYRDRRRTGKTKAK